MHSPLKHSGAVIRSPVILWSRPQGLPSPEAQDHRNTTFAGQQKTVERASMDRTPSAWRVL